MAVPFIFFVLSLLAGLTFTVIYDPYIRKNHRYAMLVIIAMCVSLIVQNYVEDQLGAGEARILARTLSSIIGYVLRPMVIVMFLYIVAPKREHILPWILAALNAGVYMTALFSDIAFRIDAENHYQGGPLRYCCLIVSALLLIYLLWLTVHEYRQAPKREMVIPALIIAIVGASIWADGQVGGARQPITNLTVAMVISCALYYIWLHMQFVREHEEDLKAQQRIQIMMSQIRPHFLYNALAAIQALCHSDPEKAADVTNQFSLYLRENLDFMDIPGLIPFWKELDHVKTYVNIEETRFPNVRVEYGIRDSDFSLPPLTVQPVVENAIRHGVRIREEGIVQVFTQMKDDMHEIIIRDNGQGFDPDTLQEKESDHIGLRNVRERIEGMCGGTLTVESSIGKGTTVTIRIPAGADAETRKENGENRL